MKTLFVALLVHNTSRGPSWSSNLIESTVLVAPSIPPENSNFSYPPVIGN